MTKKDYIKIAKVLRDFHPAMSTQERDIYGNTIEVDGLVGAIADILAEDNPRFNRERFYSAVYS